MSNESAPPVTVRYTAGFKRNLRQLLKKYRQVKNDVQPLLAELAQGQTPGDQVPGVQYEVFKVRVRNSDSGKGKSGGYRVIYQRTSEGVVVLITIYSKTEQEDIAAHEIREIILADENQQRSESFPSANVTEDNTPSEGTTTET